MPVCQSELKSLGPDGPVMGTRMVLKWILPYGEHICCCEGVFLSLIWMPSGSSGSLALFLACMTWSQSSGHLVGGLGMPVPVPAVGDSICMHDESA